MIIFRSRGPFQAGELQRLHEVPQDNAQHDVRPGRIIIRIDLNFLLRLTPKNIHFKELYPVFMQFFLFSSPLISPTPLFFFILALQ